jgi:hypothetical protein
MSILSSLILPELEKQLIAYEPMLADFAVKQLHKLGSELVAYAESKMGMNTATPIEGT